MTQAHDIAQDIEYRSETLRVAADHPSLAGHFPGNPVVPAVVGLQTVTDLLQAQRPQWRLLGIRQAKFMSPLLPQESFVIRLSGRLPAIEFQCQTDDRLIAKGTLDVGLRENEAA